MILRVVFNTSTVVSALVFAKGRVAWLRRQWKEGRCVPLQSEFGAAELSRVLGYSKFKLSANDRHELLADYLPYCESISVADRCLLVCRDSNGQPFLDLALPGRADVLASSDRDLLALSGESAFRIETPDAYRRRFENW